MQQHWRVFARGLLPNVFRPLIQIVQHQTLTRYNTSPLGAVYLESLSFRRGALKLLRNAAGAYIGSCQQDTYWFSVSCVNANRGSSMLRVAGFERRLFQVRFTFSSALTTYSRIVPNILQYHYTCSVLRHPVSCACSVVQHYKLITCRPRKCLPSDVAL